MEPQINADERRLNALSEKIIGVTFEVMKTISILLPDQYPHEIEEACKQEVLDKLRECN